MQSQHKHINKTIKQSNGMTETGQCLPHQGGATAGTSKEMVTFSNAVGLLFPLNFINVFL